MSFTFKELLKHSNKKQKKKQKKQKEEEEDGDDQIALGPFPASVHKLWSLRQRGWEPAPGPTLLPARGGAIAVCLTIVDRFPHEDFWRRWLAGGGSNDPRGRIGRMHFHAKHPERVRASQPWVGERTLEHSYCPEWNDIKVARAMLALLAAALSVGTGDTAGEERAEFIYLGTESCLPIVPFSAAADVLWSSGNSAHQEERGRSFLNAWPADAPLHSLLRRATKFEEQSQFGVVNGTVFPPTAVWKALPGWHVLSRQHAQAIVDLEQRVGGQLWPAFEPCFAPEEIFFPSMLALAGYTVDPDGDAAAASASSSSSSSSSSSASSLPSGPPAAGAAPTKAATAVTAIEPQPTAISAVVPRSLVFAKYPTSGENRANPIAWDGNFDRGMLLRLRREGFILSRKFKEPISRSLQDMFLTPPEGSKAPPVERREGTPPSSASSSSSSSSSSSLPLSSSSSLSFPGSGARQPPPPPSSLPAKAPQDRKRRRSRSPSPSGMPGSLPSSSGSGWP